MEPEGSLRHSRLPATCPYSAPDRSYWIPNSTNTLSEYVILIDFPLQQWLHERVSMLCYTYTAWLIYYIISPLCMKDKAALKTP